MSDKLKNIVSRQKEILAELESEARSIESSDLVKENAELKAALRKVTADFAAAEKKLKNADAENKGLKNALYKQTYDEKLAFLNLSKQKADIYFKANLENELNRLDMLEKNMKIRIDGMTDVLKRNNVDIKDDVFNKLKDIYNTMNEKITLARAEANKSAGAFSNYQAAEFEKLKAEQITGEQIRAVAQKNNSERFVGLRLMNWLGIFLVIIGVIAFARFTYTSFSDEAKGIAIFLLGGAMLAAGEWLSRTKANVFSLGITAGGVAVLYIALAVSYFGLGILGMGTAIVLCILITAGAFILSTRHNSQTIATFALIGGYLPISSIAGNLPLIYGAMIYFVALNLLALTLSFKKKWVTAAFTGLVLNIGGTFYICANISSMFWREPTFMLMQLFTILYVIFAFVIYAVIPIISTYNSKQRFTGLDVTFIAVNTFFSSIIMYFVFNTFNLASYNGLLAIIFAVIYLLLGKVIDMKFDNEKNVRALFYLTGLAFVVLIVPLQFENQWFSLGWLAEGVAIATYGILNDERQFKKYGAVIGALCLASFWFFDITLQVDNLFTYKYFAITLGSLIILGALIYKKSLASEFEKAFKYVTVLNFWWFCVYMIMFKLEPLLIPQHLDYFNHAYICSALAIIVSFLLAYIVPRFKILCDGGIKLISGAIYVIAILWLFVVNTAFSPINGGIPAAEPQYAVIGTVILLLISLLSVLALFDLIKSRVLDKNIGVEWLPIVVSGYFVLLLTQNLISQYNLEFSNAAISIIYVFTALAWIMFGFAKRYSFIRRFGLGLAFFSVVKLILLDLYTLTEEYKIVSYFVLGITLLAISFVYQYFSKRLELKGEVMPDAENEI